MAKNIADRMRKENNRLGNLDPDSQKGKGCCGGIANIEAGGDIYLKGDTTVDMKGNSFSIIDYPKLQDQSDGAVYFTLNGDFPPSVLFDPPITTNFSGIVDFRPLGGDLANYRIIGTADNKVGFGEHTVITGVAGDDFTASSSATLYTVYGADGKSYLEQESISRKSGNAEIFQGSITYNTGDATLLSASISKPGSTGDAVWSAGAYSEASGASGGITTNVVARGYATNSSILLKLSAEDVGVSLASLSLTPTGFNIQGLPAYADDADAGLAGLVAGDEYQTDGTGGAPLNVAGIRMVKQ